MSEVYCLIRFQHDEPQIIEVFQSREQAETAQDYAQRLVEGTDIEFEVQVAQFTPYNPHNS